LTERGRLLLPLLDSLRQLGLSLGCNDCEDRRERIGIYCEPCPLNDEEALIQPVPVNRPAPAPSRRDNDDSIVLL